MQRGSYRKGNADRILLGKKHKGQPRCEVVLAGFLAQTITNPQATVPWNVEVMFTVL